MFGLLALINNTTGNNPGREFGRIVKSKSAEKLSSAEYKRYRNEVQEMRSACRLVTRVIGEGCMRCLLPQSVPNVQA